MIGGIEKGGSKGEMKTVLRMNITDETMEELPPIQKNRAFHSREVSERRVLISGGKKGKYVMDDEIYSLWTNESIVLKTSKSLRRHQHHLLALGSTIYAFGGTKENGLPTDQVEKFDWETNSWVVHDHSLLSKDTKNYFSNKMIAYEGVRNGCPYLRNLPQKMRVIPRRININSKKTFKFTKNHKKNI